MTRNNDTGAWTIETLLEKANPTPKQGDYATVAGIEYRWNDLEKRWESIGAMEAEENGSDVTLRNKIGDYDNLFELWRETEGQSIGVGDYASVDGTDYYWTGASWRATASGTESRSVHVIDHDLTVGHDLRVGGTLYASIASMENYDQLLQEMLRTIDNEHRIMSGSILLMQRQINDLETRMQALAGIESRLSAVEQTVEELVKESGGGSGMTPEERLKLNETATAVADLGQRSRLWDEAAEMWTTEEDNVKPTKGRGIVTDGNVIAYGNE